MKRNLVGKILGKIKIFVQDFVPIRTALRVRNVVDATRFFGCMVASRGGYRMARGRHYAKLSLSNAARLSFSDLCILLFLFLSLCRLCVRVFLCSHWSLVDVPLIFFCPADHVPDWQPRVLLGMVEARSVNVKKTTTTTTSLQLLLQTWCGSAPRRGPSANGYDAWRFGSCGPARKILAAAA